MSGFTTRIELHDASSDDYDTLHNAMAMEGFSRTITSNDGIVYHLPWAEYNIQGNYTRDVVLEKAKRAAAKTRTKYAVLVTESAGRVWHGLEKVHASHTA